MFYKLPKYSFLRIYEDVGYIYNKETQEEIVTDSSGAVFLSALSRKPQLLDDIAFNISKNFVDVDFQTIKKDAIDYFDSLEKEGFIVSGNTIQEIEQNEKTTFSIVNKPNKIQNISIAKTVDDVSRYFKQNSNQTPQLMTFQIELTNRCNEHCVHCYIPHKQKNHDSNPNLIYDVLEQCKEMKVINLSLSGGEPLLHPNFCSFVNKAKECDFSIDVFSNLTLLNNEILSVMKNDIYSIFHVSLYSLNPSVHDSITQVAGSFEKTFSGILELLNNEIPLQINCMVMKQNKDCFTDVIKWGHERNIKIGVDTMMMAMNNHDTSNLKNRLSLKETKKALRDIISTDLIFQKNILSSEFDYFLNNRKNIINESVCGICQSSLSMDSFGNIIPCPGWDSYIMGNIAKQPLKTIWEKSQFVQNLREIKRNDFKKCRNCDDIGFCSLCMADNANANLNGNPILINKHICKVASLNHKIVMDWKTKHQKGENNDSTKYDFESLALRDTSKLEAVL